MAICGHHYPIEGCHNCWEWLWEQSDQQQKLLDYLEETGAVSAQQIDAALDELDRRAGKLA